jgi:hypothetical protein
MLMEHLNKLFLSRFSKVTLFILFKFEHDLKEVLKVALVELFTQLVIQLRVIKVFSDLDFVHFSKGVEDVIIVAIAYEGAHQAAAEEKEVLSSDDLGKDYFHVGLNRTVQA